MAPKRTRDEETESSNKRSRAPHDGFSEQQLNRLHNTWVQMADQYAPVAPVHLNPATAPAFTIPARPNQGPVEQEHDDGIIYSNGIAYRAAGAANRPNQVSTRRYRSADQAPRARREPQVDLSGLRRDYPPGPMQTPDPPDFALRHAVQQGLRLHSNPVNSYPGFGEEHDAPPMAHHPDQMAHHNNGSHPTWAANIPVRTGRVGLGGGTTHPPVANPPLESTYPDHGSVFGAPLPYRGRQNTNPGQGAARAPDTFFPQLYTNSEQWGAAAPAAYGAQQQYTYPGLRGEQARQFADGFRPAQQPEVEEDLFDFGLGGMQLPHDEERDNGRNQNPYRSPYPPIGRQGAQGARNNAIAQPVAAPGPDDPEYYPYKCDHCDLRFHLPRSKIRHQNSEHTRRVTHPCPHCGKLFYRTDTLADHVNSQHLGLGRRLSKGTGIARGGRRKK
ncbi:uncharacterized protein J3D65DRAFT_658139 [Phyllosticta citribraziliensis]|uniref:C2H2-type domain-containing protein n=1 Tax=Phyllosticta citribraziliensis TaxID=989973 RepID=A0ABR1LU58_9PEZI